MDGVRKRTSRGFSLQNIILTGLTVGELKKPRIDDNRTGQGFGDELDSSSRIEGRQLRGRVLDILGDVP